MSELSVLLGPIFESFAIDVAYLFGSRSRGTASERSDYDIAVLPAASVAARERLDLRLNLANALGRALSTDAIDLVLLDEVTPLLGHRVLRDGQVLLCRDERVRVRLEVRLLNEYLDTRPLDEEYNRHLIDRYAGSSAGG